MVMIRTRVFIIAARTIVTSFDHGRMPLPQKNPALARNGVTADHSMVHLQQRVDVENRKTPTRLLLRVIKSKSSKYQEVFGNPGIIFFLVMKNRQGDNNSVHDDQGFRKDGRSDKTGAGIWDLFTCPHGWK
jgi:hypothetical protein